MIENMKKENNKADTCKTKQYLLMLFSKHCCPSELRWPQAVMEVMLAF